MPAAWWSGSHAAHRWTRTRSVRPLDLQRDEVEARVVGDDGDAAPGRGECLRDLRVRRLDVRAEGQAGGLDGDVEHVPRSHPGTQDDEALCDERVERDAPASRPRVVGTDVGPHREYGDRCPGEVGTGTVEDEGEVRAVAQRQVRVADLGLEDGRHGVVGTQSGDERRDDVGERGRPGRDRQCARDGRRPVRRPRRVLRRHAAARLVRRGRNCAPAALSVRRPRARVKRSTPSSRSSSAQLPREGRLRHVEGDRRRR